MLVVPVMNISPTLHSFREQPRPRSSTRGFTLIEMMVTVAIAVILLGIGIPTFTSFIEGQTVKTASFDLSAALMFARSEAIKRNTDVVFAPATGGWQNGWTIKVATTTLSTKDTFPGVTISGPANVTYGNDGRVQNATAEFEISGSSSSRCIRIGLSGQPTRSKGACA